MHRILVVEDSPEFQKIIQRALGSYRITQARTAEEAWIRLGKEPIDLVLLDISLPDRDGYSLLTDMQNSSELKSIPVICLTGKKAMTDKVTAFSLGADDYIEKPFDSVELKIRIDAKIAKKRQLESDADRLVVAEIIVDRQSHRATLKDDFGEREVKLTQTEFKLLYRLISRPDQVFSRDQLLVSAWGEGANVLDRAVDVHLCSLRKKLGNSGSRIEAIPGVGYRFALKQLSALKPKRAV